MPSRPTPRSSCRVPVTSLVTGQARPWIVPKCLDPLDYEASSSIVPSGKRRPGTSPRPRRSSTVGYTPSTTSPYLSRENFQRKTSQWDNRGKTFDGNRPLGPWVVNLPTSCAGRVGLRIMTAPFTAQHHAGFQHLRHDLLHRKTMAFMTRVHDARPANIICPRHAHRSGARQEAARLDEVGDKGQVEVEKIGFLAQPHRGTRPEAALVVAGLRSLVSGAARRRHLSLSTIRSECRGRGLSRPDAAPPVADGKPAVVSPALPNRRRR